MIDRFKRIAGALLIALVRLYQLFISPISGPCCRYHPSCSNYAIEAIRVHGPWRGTFLGVWRLLRCNPWSAGGADPIPRVEDRKIEVDHVAG